MKKKTPVFFPVEWVRKKKSSVQNGVGRFGLLSGLLF